MHFVACKTVREYNRNREKIRKFCLEEKKQLQVQEKVQEQRSDETTASPSGLTLSPTQQAGPSKKQTATKPKGQRENARHYLPQSEQSVHRKTRLTLLIKNQKKRP